MLLDVELQYKQRIKELEAMIAEKDEEIRKCINLDHKHNLTTIGLIEQIAALQATSDEYYKRLCDMVDQRDALKERVESLQARIKELEDKVIASDIEIDHQEQDNLTLQAKVKELEEELNCLKEDFKVAAQTRNELWDRVKELEALK
jgi:chromosome segregation ATPase